MPVTPEATPPNELPYALARDEGLMIVELADETIVYDLDRNQAHCLNQCAAAIWRACDGHASEQDVAHSVSEHLGLPLDSDTVTITLARLGRAHLLKARGRESAVPTCTRRELVRRMKLAGLAPAALPAIISAAAPDAATAGNSCQKKTKACSPSLKCCAGCSCPSSGPNKNKCTGLCST